MTNESDGSYRIIEAGNKCSGKSEFECTDAKGCVWDTSTEKCIPVLEFPLGDEPHT